MIIIQLIGLVLAVLLLLLVLVRYRTAFPYLLVMVYTYSFIGSLPKFSFGPVNVFAWDLIYLLAGLNLVIRLLLDRSYISRQAWMASNLCLMFFAYLAFSEVYSWYFLENVPLDSLIRNIIAQTYPFIVVSVLLSLQRKDMELFAKVLLAAVAVIIFRLFYLEIMDIGTWVTSSGTIRRMPGEVIPAMLFLVVYALFVKGINKYIRLGLLFIGVVAVGLIGHRSGYLALVSIFGFFFIYLIYTGEFARFLGQNILYLTLGSMALVIFIFGFKSDAVDRVFERAADITNTGETNASDRLNKWKVALQTTKENPLGGTKLNLLPDYYGHRLAVAAFGSVNPALAHSMRVYTQSDETWPPHNVFINIVSKSGVIGLLLFLSIVIYALATVHRHGDFRYKFFCTAWIIGNFVHLLFNNHSAPSVAIPLFMSLIIFPILFMNSRVPSFPSKPRST